MWATLLPVIVGGTIGLIGGVVGPPLTHWLSQRSARRVMRAEKFEELVRVLHMHHHWLDQKKSEMLFGFPASSEPRPFANAQAITDVYFAEFSLSVMQLDTKSTEYELCLSKAALKRIDEPKSDFQEGVVDSYSDYLKTFMKLNHDLRIFASRLIA